MAKFYVSLFGLVEMRKPDGMGYCRLTARSQALLAHLCLATDQRLSRPKLAGLVWPEFSEARARRALSTELWRLKSTAASGHDVEPQFLDGNADEVWLAGAPDVDARQFERETAIITRLRAEQMTRTDRAKLRAGLELYQADLCEALDDAALIVARQMLRARRDAGWIFLMEAALARSVWNEAIELGRVLLAIDPLQENVHRKLIRAFLKQGNRPLALRQYQQLEEILADELGTVPMDETQALLGHDRAQERAMSPSRRDCIRQVDQIQSQLSGLRRMMAD